MHDACMIDQITIIIINFYQIFTQNVFHQNYSHSVSVNLCMSSSDSSVLSSYAMVPPDTILLVSDPVP